MASIVMNENQFAQYVKDALAHFHDRAYLQTHPLARILLTGPMDGHGGARLQRRILTSVEELTPHLGSHADAPEWRRARYLFLRYMERQTHEQIVIALGISHRQGHRDHQEGLASIASLMWSQRPGPDRADSSTPMTLEELIDAQAQRLATDSQRGPSDLLVALDHAITMTSDLVANRGIRIVLSGAEDLPPAMMDEAMLAQVVLAAVSLGVATCTGSTLSVDLSRDDLSISLVIAPCHPLTEESEARLGVIRQLIESQEGGIRVVGRQSQETEEVAIELILPLALPRCVLVIDDDPDFMRLLTRYLVGVHFRTITATSVEEGMRLAREASPDLIILDVFMPSHDGWELLRELHMLPGLRAVPVLVCSVLADRELARSLGAADVLPKPVTQRALLTAIEKHCRTPEPEPRRSH